MRSKAPLIQDDARSVLSDLVGHYHEQRLHSAIRYVTPEAKLLGRTEAVIAARRGERAAAQTRRLAEIRTS